MTDHDQKDAMIRLIITNLTVIVARKNRPKSEKSISLAAASVSASIGSALYKGPSRGCSASTALFSKALFAAILAKCNVDC
jgi:hypothetical protein